jgi:hypothetical protein
VKIDQPQGRSELAEKISNSTSAQIWIVLAASLAFYFVFRIAGAAQCGPNGQCGMAAYIETVFGFVGAVIIFIVGGARALWAQRQRERRALKQRRKGIRPDAEHDFGSALFRERLADDAPRSGEERVRSRE